MAKKIIYASPNYAKLRRDNGYFVDKTAYIAKLEQVENPVFLRPRRFGKSFLCSILHYYYDLHYKDEFESFFGDTWIGQNPTGKQNQYIVLHLNFSVIEPGPTLADIETSFKHECNYTLHLLRSRYLSYFNDLPPLDLNAPVSQNFSYLITHIAFLDCPPLYVIIDEYDNFANRLIITHQDHLYRELMADDSFLKIFFKVLKKGRENGSIENVYITGILPMTIDDLASAFNVATFLTLDPAFEAMIGFTQDEVDQLLDDIFIDHAFPANIRSDIDSLIKNHYNGYHFVIPALEAQSPPVYNTTILMYFLRYLTAYQEIPVHLTDANLKTDLSWIKRLTTGKADLTEELIDQLTLHEVLPYNRLFLTNQFNVAQFFEKSFFPISFFYLGLLTRQDKFYLTFPNLNTHQIFIEYFNELHQIETINPYIKTMEAFVRQPDLEALFRCYWEEYISQLPEAIFAQVNENFYRTTFYELCHRHLSPWFIWNVERSYPQGKSDLEFVGKYHEKFAGLRWVIEFKYYSKRTMREKKIDVPNFTVQAEDTKQIQGYVQGLLQEYPEAQVSQFVIYCFGNQDFRVFQVS